MNNDKMNLISHHKRLYFKRLNTNNIFKCSNKNQIIKKFKNRLKEKIKLNRQKIINKTNHNKMN